MIVNLYLPISLESFRSRCFTLSISGVLIERVHFAVSHVSELGLVPASLCTDLRDWVSREQLAKLDLRLQNHSWSPGKSPEGWTFFRSMLLVNFFISFPQSVRLKSSFGRSISRGIPWYFLYLLLASRLEAEKWPSFKHVGKVC